MPTVRGIVRSASAADYRFSSLIVGIVTSDAFQMNMKTTDAVRQTASR
jgi:hypothetical protein